MKKSIDIVNSGHYILETTGDYSSNYKALKGFYKEVLLPNKDTIIKSNKPFTIMFLPSVFRRDSKDTVLNIEGINVNLVSIGSESIFISDDNNVAVISFNDCSLKLSNIKTNSFIIFNSGIKTNTLNIDNSNIKISSSNNIFKFNSFNSRVLFDFNHEHIQINSIISKHSTILFDCNRENLNIKSSYFDFVDSNLYFHRTASNKMILNPNVNLNVDTIRLISSHLESSNVSLSIKSNEINTLLSNINLFSSNKIFIEKNASISETKISCLENSSILSNGSETSKININNSEFYIGSNCSIMNNNCNVFVTNVKFFLDDSSKLFNNSRNVNIINSELPLPLEHLHHSNITNCKLPYITNSTNNVLQNCFLSNINNLESLESTNNNYFYFCRLKFANINKNTYPSTNKFFGCISNLELPQE
jgi:hypothetical protein